ncbi:uncharacterized protein [Physcomitrium patens]|uniref:uncharacterized protein isoform X2 n=1 Tax=Physcomitrium patens TaxID=3218 RepID=UPI003CCCEDF0
MTVLVIRSQLRMEAIHPLDMLCLSRHCQCLEKSFDFSCVLCSRWFYLSDDGLCRCGFCTIFRTHLRKPPQIWRRLDPNVFIPNDATRFEEGNVVRVGVFTGTDSETGKAGGDADAADVQLKKPTTKVVDVKEVMHVDSILAGVMPPTCSFSSCTTGSGEQHISPNRDCSGTGSSRCRARADFSRSKAIKH